MEVGRGGLFAVDSFGEWRIAFRWTGRDAHDVRLADYH